MDETNRFNPPESTALDDAHKLTKTLLGLSPAAVFEHVFTPPLQRRLEKWRESIGRGLQDLCERVEGFEGRLSDDSFIDTSMQALQIASRTSQNERLEALRNAVLNSVLPNAPEQSLQQIFLSYIDRFTEWHLRILKLFENPEKWFRDNNRKDPRDDLALSGSRSDVLIAAYPELKVDREFYDQIIKDLYENGLFGVNSMHGVMTLHGIMSSVIPEDSLGKRFLDFISDPSTSI